MNRQERMRLFCLSKRSNLPLPGLIEVWAAGDFMIRLNYTLSVLGDSSLSCIPAVFPSRHLPRLFAETPEIPRFPVKIPYQDLHAGPGESFGAF